MEQPKEPRDSSEIKRLARLGQFEEIAERFGEHYAKKAVRRSARPLAPSPRPLPPLSQAPPQPRMRPLTPASPTYLPLHRPFLCAAAEVGGR